MSATKGMSPSKWQEVSGRMATPGQLSPLAENLMVIERMSLPGDRISQGKEFSGHQINRTFIKGGKEDDKGKSVYGCAATA